MRQIKLHEKHALECEDLGFTIGPRLNAAGRLGQAELAIELLTTDSEVRAEKLAQYIDELNPNGNRWSGASSAAPTSRPTSGSIRPATRRSCWPTATGIPASSASSPDGSPTSFTAPPSSIALDKLGVKPGIGSARSVPGFNLHAALADCSEQLVSHGGHAAAAGLKVDRSESPRLPPQVLRGRRPRARRRPRSPNCSSTPRPPSAASRSKPSGRSKASPPSATATCGRCSAPATSGWPNPPSGSAAPAGTSR